MIEHEDARSSLPHADQQVTGKGTVRSTFGAFFIADVRG